MSASENPPLFAVKPAGSNPDAINDWYDLDAIFQDDFFPQDIDFSGLLNDETPLEGSTNDAYSSNINNATALEPRGRTTRAVRVHAAKITEASKRKAQAKQNSDSENDMELSDEQRGERRDRNREHAKRSRIRKRVLLDTLQDQMTELRAQNVKLRRVVAERLPAHLAAEVLLRCTTEESTLLLTGSAQGQGSDSPAAEERHRPSALTSKITGLQAWPQQDTAATAPSSSSSAGKAPKILMEPDYRLIRSLITSQQNFVLSDPSLPDNPIVYASDGFCRLSGYRRQDVLGRNCRFLQGPGTDQAAVEVIRQGVRDGRDVSVCLLNYRADGKPFWNQFFLGALKDAAGQVVNYVGVQCEVNTLPVAGMKERVKKLPLPGV